MTEQEIKDGNELLAVFMGGKWSTPNWGGVPTRCFYLPKSHISEPIRDFLDGLPYHADWSWIMPVWIKFRDLNIDSKEYSDWLSSLSWYMYTANEPKALFERLVYAIKWYNNEKDRSGKGV